MYTGQITGTGPRYCPSIEDKIVRFPHRERHLLFLEPESLETDRIYVNGLSSSLPPETQDRVVHAITGLEHARILQHGYAVEYDFSDPRDLDRGLQHKALPGLFLAGQVNGTSGYEEAAVQGFVAGVSAARGEPFTLGRDEAYIGVLIDDLVTRGVGGEPYRMFTSRAEHRLLLREDNADRRLMPRGRALGLVEDSDWRAFEDREAQASAARVALAAPVLPSARVLSALAAEGLGGLKKPSTGEALLRRPQTTYPALAAALGLPGVEAEVATWLETDAKYAGYLRQARARAKETRRLAALPLSHVDYGAIPGLSTEVRHRLTAARPRDLDAAGRLPGVTPAAVTVLAVWVARHRRCDP